MNYARLSFAATLLSSCLTLVAHAQSTVSGFSIDRFEPSERGSEWFALDSLDLRGRVRGAAGLIADYGYKPLVYYDADGKEVGTLVKHQLFLHAGASLIVGERLRLSVNLPFAALVKGDDGLAGTQQFTVDEGVALGDLRLSADLRLFGKYRGPITGALGLSVWAPTGGRRAFAGDGKVRVAPHVALAGELARFNYAVRVGFNYRAQDGSFSGAQIGSELAYGIAIGIRAADDRLLIGPELYGSTVVKDGLFRERGTPLEGVFGMHYLIANTVRIGAGVGAGFTQGFGTPEVRALGSIEWAPGMPPEPSDRDGDGILDGDDACPDEPGVRSDDPRKNGCPLRDRDGDGIYDDDDACPDAAGPPNEDPKKHGCPPARIEEGQIKIIEQIKFRFNSSEILPESEPIMHAVLKILEEHTEITKLSVEGHTDHVGGPKFNKGLSERRVMSVLSWLTSHGLEPIRLTSFGYGLERPIASNETEEGRAQNRRVEFHIKEVHGKPVDAQGNPLDAGQE